MLDNNVNRGRRVVRKQLSLGEMLMLDLSQKAEQALRMVREAKLLTYDTETSGLDWKRNFPVGWVIGSGSTDVVYVPTRHGGGGNLPDISGRTHAPVDADAPYVPHAFEIELAKAFEHRTQQKIGRTIGHHIKFDAHFSANVGVMLGRDLSCTQNNEALLNEYARSFSLENVAKAHGVTAKLGQELYDHLSSLFGEVNTSKSMANFWRLAGNDPLAVDYAEGDGVTTFEVYKKQAPLLEGENLGQIWEIENKLIWTLFRAERRGMPIDQDYVHAAMKTITEKIEGAKANLPHEFNPRSGVQVKAYVEQFATDWPTTEKGNPSFTEKWLKTFPEGGNILTLRKWTNLNNSFFTPLIDTHTYNGRVHPQLNQMKADDFGAVGGRLSCSNPNLQAVPKHDKERGRMIRTAFMADEGKTINEADWSQAEPRLFAHYSQDERLIDGYNANPPKDVHTIVAEMLNVDRGTTGKRMNMGVFTGMFPKTFAEHMGMPIGEATNLWNTWFKLFPKVKNFQVLAKSVMSTRGYVRTILGRRGRREQPRFDYKATSKIIQGSQADMMKLKMLEIDMMLEEMGDPAYLVMQVHDSLIWMAPDTPEGEALSIKIEGMMSDVQCPPYNLRVPFVVERDKGKSWGEASYGAT